MNSKFEAMLPLIAALLVLFTSMWKPEVSFIVAISSLILLSVYAFLKKK